MWIALSAPEAPKKLVQITEVKHTDSVLVFDPALDAAELDELNKAGPITIRRRVTYFTQPQYPDAPEVSDDGRYLVYLDVWPRHVSAVEDPAIREVALGGPDTATRMQTVWQVKLLEVDEPADCVQFPPGWRHPEDQANGKLEARTAPAPPDTGPCLLPPGSGYLGLENQLYRVEIHKPGGLNEATFKWSRDNGSVVTGVTDISGKYIGVQDLGRSENLGFITDQWVELLGDWVEFQGKPGELMLIDDIKPAEKQIFIANGAFDSDDAG